MLCARIMGTQPLSFFIQTNEGAPDHHYSDLTRTESVTLYHGLSACARCGVRGGAARESWQRR